MCIVEGDWTSLSSSQVRRAQYLQNDMNSIVFRNTTNNTNLSYSCLSRMSTGPTNTEYTHAAMFFEIWIFIPVQRMQAEDILKFFSQAKLLNYQEWLPKLIMKYRLVGTRNPRMTTEQTIR
jgi:hypothetical protein